MKETIQQLIKELLAKMGQKGEVEVEKDKESEGFKVKIKTDEPGMLIGFHGRTLSSLQLILGIMVFRQLGEWQRVVVDVNDYRQEQGERLKQIALNAAKRSQLSQGPVVLSPMSSFERRLIHLALTDIEGVETASEGEGSQRRVVIQPTKTESVKIKKCARKP